LQESTPLPNAKAVVPMPFIMAIVLSFLNITLALIALMLIAVNKNKP
jgi:hypothetical protein